MKEQFLRSLFVHERLQLLHNHEITRAFSQQQNNSALEEWFQFALVQTEAKRKAKLESLGVNELIFGSLIQTTQDLKWNESCLPAIMDYNADWLTVLEEALELNCQIKIKENEQRSIELLVRPFLLWANMKLENLLASIDAQGKYISTSLLISSILPHLTSQLCKIAGRSFVLELHVAKAMQELAGDTPEERFSNFVEKHMVDNGNLRLFFLEYAMFARLLSERTVMFVTVIEEAITRFIQDWKVLKDTFQLEESPLIAIKADLGDSHKGGKTVMRFQLKSGQSFMYKPKSLAVSHAFHTFLSWINSKGFYPEFKGVPIIDRKEYGYEAFVRAEQCETKDQIRSFYRRLGAYLGVVHLLEGADFHSENIIACGEHPMLIDLETLFHNQVKQDVPDSADVEAQFAIRNSPIGTSFLPILFHQDEKGLGIELSGLNDREQLIPYNVLKVVDMNTDNMRYIRARHITTSSHNLPSLNGTTISAADYLTDYVNGYRDICYFFIENREEMLSTDGPLKIFSKVPVRILLRTSQFYMNFLLELTHPDYGRDALDYERLLDRMWFSYLDDRLISSEIKDLRIGDIPYFYSFPDSHHLWDSRDQKIDNVFKETAMDHTKQKLLSLTPEKIELYAKWITESIIGSSLSKKIHSVEPEAANMDTTKESVIKSDQFLNEAVRIGEQLVKEAILSRNERTATWIGLNPNYLGQLGMSGLRGGLYDGTGGISLFFAHLYRITQKQHFKKYSLAAFQSTLEKFPMTIKFPSSFYGQASVLYVITQLENIMGENKEWKQHRLNLLDNLSRSVEQDTFYDLLGGAAGAIHVLLNESKIRGSEQEIEIASMYGDHLLKNAQKSDKGYFWQSSVLSDVYVGLGHGSMGIAWALFRLAAVTGKEAYREAAENALQYVRSHYSSEWGNWVDCEAGTTLANWCHGASGIGIGLTMCLPFLRSSQVNQVTNEIEQAVATTIRYGFGKSHCLCHGDLGNLELLLLAGKYLNRQEWVEMARGYGREAVNYYQSKGEYLTGITKCSNIQGLWLGLSGIGYQMLRLASDKDFPSILSLQEPLVQTRSLR
ncbi:type 2 lantipeptide synthetase LanM [Paenibacillus macerans]|uniref:Type 2 lantipeptide synthetase LanM n=1 Tax=Paenibacillus macerans TaxID=44252 RepID=A0A6N8EVX3_PAEMA|nr:type 2 lanthipeptide synthetase LanM family protein [Paenibacillus macerans]MUG24029.1 type 2 lantipeptide synthetase LanM [Paenibacillus macerans]